MSAPTPAPVPAISPFGDRAVEVAWSAPGVEAGAYAEALSDRALGLARVLREGGGFTDVSAGYRSVLASFDPAAHTLEEREAAVRAALLLAPAAPPEGKLVDVPVAYGGESGPDLAALSEQAGLSEAQAVELHAGKTYRVCFLGFVPGFAFLSAAPSALHRPRHASPRARVPAGSVGIAGWQTGIYGQSSPGGWQIIGRTSFRPFQAGREPEFALQAGDRVRFVPST